MAISEAASAVTIEDSESLDQFSNDPSGQIETRTAIACANSYKFPIFNPKAQVLFSSLTTSNFPRQNQNSQQQNQNTHGQNSIP